MNKSVYIYGYRGNERMHFRDRVASKYWYDTIQNTRYGCLEGYRSGKTLVFRGVPYGKAERWSLPEYPDAWDGVRDATLSGPMGIHVNRDGVLTGVEDCLNMDIYRPDTQQTGRIRWISRSSLMQQTSSLSA